MVITVLVVVVAVLVVNVAVLVVDVWFPFHGFPTGFQNYNNGLETIRTFSPWSFLWASSSIL